MKASLIYRKKHIAADGGIIEIKIWSVAATLDTPEGVKYSMVYVRDGKRLVGQDNAEGKGHHRHVGDKEVPYAFRSVSRLFRDFRRDVATLKKGEWK